MKRYAPLVITVITVVGCIDSQPAKVDTGAAANRQPGAERVDMIQLDSIAPSPSQSGTYNNKPSAPVIGESRRDAAPTSRPRESGDPMPPLAGETNNRSGTMRPVDPVLRDSASGPRFRIDSTGKAKPIRR